MISAREAKMRTEVSSHENSRNGIDLIERDIMLAVNRGNYAITGSGYLPGEVEDTLRNSGYRVVVEHDGHNDVYYRVSWFH